MILCHPGILAIFIISLSRCQLFQLDLRDKDYHYLPRESGVFRYNLSFPVKIDRKAYSNLWIYKNGFVTLGSALEQEAYPKLIVKGRFEYQPIENLMGENIIGVFITINKMMPHSVVRVKEWHLKDTKGYHAGTLQRLENIITSSNLGAIIRPIEHVVQIEWTNMQVEGEEYKKNSFRLFILSNFDQSFTIFEYWSIETVSYKLFSRVFNYQAGIRSYANRDYIVPFQDVSDPAAPLTRSSNIGIRNMWLLNLGDLSYNIDLGSPTSVSLEGDTKPSLSTAPPRYKEYSGVVQVSEAKHQVQTPKYQVRERLRIRDIYTTITNGGRSLRYHKRGERSPFTSATYWQTRLRSSIPSMNEDPNVLTTGSTDQVGPLNSAQRRSVKENKEFLLSRLTSARKLINNSGEIDQIVPDLFSSRKTSFKFDEELQKSWPSSRPKSIENDDKKTQRTFSLRISLRSISSSPSKERSDSKSMSLDPTGRSHSISTSEHPISRMNSSTEWTLRVDHKSTVGHKYSESLNDIRRGSLVKIIPSAQYSANTSRSAISGLSTSTNGPISTTTISREVVSTNSKSELRLDGDEYIVMKYAMPSRESEDKAPFSNYAYCNEHSCDSNQECFIFKGTTCCQCVSETVHLGSKCERIDERRQMRSHGSVIIYADVDSTFLQLYLHTTVTNNFHTTFLTLQSSSDMTDSLRNFLILLYPIFHIPMAFYASSWRQQQVPNLISLTSNLVGISIHVAIDGYGDLLVTFKLTRNTEDQWTISIKTLDMGSVAALRLDGLKLDEKSSKPAHLRYTLSHKNSVDFSEQLITFTDESKNRTFNVRWKGSMTFTANCLSNYVDSRTYFVKFLDNGYCNSDCSASGSCRIMCIGLPFVFDKTPGPCEGNHCLDNKTCVEDNERYDCRCPDGLVTNGDSCTRPSSLAPESQSKSKKKRVTECSQCSSSSSCRILNSYGCCFCKSGYVGSGKTCYRRDSGFEIRGNGTLKTFNERGDLVFTVTFTLLFRQWLSGKSVNHALFSETGIFRYATSQERYFVNLVLYLSPIFDMPMLIFANDRTNNLDNSVYLSSKGSLRLTVYVDGIHESRVSITFTMREIKDSSDINVDVTGVPMETKESDYNGGIQYFEARNSPDIEYRLKGRQIVITPYSVHTFGNGTKNTIRISGSGEVGECADQEVEERTFVVSARQRIYCRARCKDDFCHPFCQSMPVLTPSLKVPHCSPSCHEQAKCIDSVCMCHAGYSGDGLVCRPILKTLECSTDLDCTNGPFLECSNSKCSCKPGTVMINNQCSLIDRTIPSTPSIEKVVTSPHANMDVLLTTTRYEDTFADPCSKCQQNEYCHENQCICRHQFIRNRISNLCTFDCSFCDVYSSICTPEMCLCKDKFVYETGSKVKCTLTCQLDSDCPVNEVCGPLRKCVCSSQRVDGMCPPSSDCSTCSGHANCQANKCKCLPDWVGDGVACKYNCSLCFQSSYCDPNLGCSCPPNYIGDGKYCTEKRCGLCPTNFECRKSEIGYRCECMSGMTMRGDECIRDVVHIDILPPGLVYFINGDQMELICMGRSMTNKFQLFWSRKSGIPISGRQYFVDQSNTTLRLALSKMRSEDADEYLCHASSRESKSVSILEVAKTCASACHKYASCVAGQCRCLDKYVGDGIDCFKPSNCSMVCPGNTVCNESDGRCHCVPGFKSDGSTCMPDCTAGSPCSRNAVCDRNTGRCRCGVGFVGNVTRCRKIRLSCQLTDNCRQNSACVRVKEMEQHICVCKDGFIGDGHTCERRVDCDRHRCGRHSVCLTVIVQDHFGNRHQNGRCRCKEGFKMVDEKCADPRENVRTLWMSMGEAIISLAMNENTSVIRFIDDSPTDSGIIVLAGDCSRRRLYWSGKKGGVIWTSSIDGIFNASILLSGLGKVAGLCVDDVTGNVFFTDSDTGRISVLDPLMNVSVTLVKPEANHRPGQIVAHSTSGKLFWAVNDFLKPRIETSRMNGEERRLYVQLDNRPIGLTIIYSDNDDDFLCWMELNDHVVNVTVTTEVSTFAYIKCSPIGDANVPLNVTLVQTILSDEPSSAFTYNDRFYWGVRDGRYLRTSDSTSYKIPISPNCCDPGVRGLVVMPTVCTRERGLINPCLSKYKMQCPQMCVQGVTAKGSKVPLCLKTDHP